MPTETFSFGRGTRGSQSVLIHERRLVPKASIPLRRYAVDSSSSISNVEEFLTPVQSAGESKPSLHIKNYLNSVVARYTELVSDSSKQIRITASPEVRATSMDPWKLKNRRRIRLIEKRYKGSLNEREIAELATLESQFSAHLQNVAPRSREVLDEFSDYVARMKAKVAAKKRTNP